MRSPIFKALGIDGEEDRNNVNCNSLLLRKLKAAFTVDYVLHHEDAPTTKDKWTKEEWKKIVSQHAKFVEHNDLKS